MPSNEDQRRPITGPELAVRRRIARLAQRDIADAMGTSRELVRNLEAYAVVTPASAARFLEALATAARIRDAK